jgi:hypothetical protein
VAYAVVVVGERRGGSYNAIAEVTVQNPQPTLDRAGPCGAIQGEECPYLPDSHKSKILPYVNADLAMECPP